MIIITVTPSRDPDGHRAYTSRGQLFDGAVDGRVVGRRSTAPLADGCRVLVAEGVDPMARVVMRHAGRNDDALRSTVGGAAGLTVRDTRGGKPVFAEHEPYDGGKLHRGSPPMRETVSAAPTLPAAAGALQERMRA